MRVERFSLFFPPLLLKKKIGETEYAIGSIPAGGYVKISGMNPAEDLPDEVRTRAYYSQPVWKRIVVIAAGPAVNLVIAFVLLFVFFGAIGRPRATNEVGSIEKSFPASGVLHTGRRAGGGRRQARRLSRQLSKRVASHKCAVSPPTKGCKAATPGRRSLIKRDGKRDDATDHPGLRPGGEAHAARASPTRRRPTREPARSARRCDLTVDHVLVHHEGRPSSSRRDLVNSRAAQADLRRRRLLRDTRQTIVDRSRPT